MVKNSESRGIGLISSILIDLHDIRVISSTLGFKILGHTQVLSFKLFTIFDNICKIWRITCLTKFTVIPPSPEDVLLFKDHIKFWPSIRSL